MNEARRLLEKVTACLPHIQGRVLDEVRHYLSKPEESCEWKQLPPCYFALYDTNCNHTTSSGDSWTHCPFCGRKIKVKT